MTVINTYLLTPLNLLSSWCLVAIKVILIKVLSSQTNVRHHVQKTILYPPTIKNKIKKNKFIKNKNKDIIMTEKKDEIKLIQELTIFILFCGDFRANIDQIDNFFAMLLFSFI